MNAIIFSMVLLFSSDPQSPTLEDCVDLIEVNYYYSSIGEPVFTQHIFWIWNPDTGEHEVMAWRMLTKEGQLPAIDYDRGGYKLIFTDSNGTVMRVVRAPAMRWTWTQRDPEMDDRARKPRQERANLQLAAPLHDMVD